MAKLDVVTIENRKAGSVKLAPGIFETAVKTHLLHAEVRRQLAVRRRGTHSTKNRHMVSGGGAKPWRQKGTGRARQGTIRAPQWAGGGVVFGPVPRGHGHELPKKVRRAALRAALSARAREGAIVVVDALAVEPAKTRRFAEILAALGIGDQKVLVVIETRDAAVERASRNLPHVRTLRAEGLNVYDVLWASRLLVTRAALAAIEARLGAATAEEEGA
jgi:large subunit ribosomal protein L4